MRKGTVIFIFLLLGVLLFIFTLKKVGINAVKDAVFMFSFLQFAFILLILTIGVILMGSFRWRVIMKETGAPIPSFGKLFLVKLVGFSLSYITPSALFGGEPARFYILKQEDEKINNKLIASIIVDKLMQTFSSAFFFLAGLFLLLFYLDLSWLTDIVMTAILLCMILFFIFLVRRVKKVSKEKGFFVSMLRALYLNKIKKINDMQDRFEQVEQEIRQFFRRPKGFIFKTMLYSFFEVIFVLIVFWLIMFFMGHMLTIPRLLVIRSMADLSSIIPFPASLGTLEITQAFVFETFGLGAYAGVALSLIFRAVSLVLAFIGLVVFAFFHLQGMINKFGKKIIEIIPTKNNEKNFST